MQKPVVRYNPAHPDTMIGVGWSADVHAIDHPRLGNLWVSTSTVKSYDKTTSEFETMNTKYVPDLSATV